MAKQARPHEPKPPKRSAGFNLDSITAPVTDFLSGYSTVQVKNGNQSILAVRADPNSVSASGAAGGDVIPTQINANGVVSLQGTARQNTTAVQAANLKKKLATFTGGQKLALFGGGAVLLLVGGVVVVTMLRK